MANHDIDQWNAFCQFYLMDSLHGKPDNKGKDEIACNCSALLYEQNQEGEKEYATS